SRAARVAGVLAFGGALIVLKTTPNLRYIYTSTPLLLVCFASLLGWTRSNQRWVYRSLIVCLVACTTLNAYFIAGSSFYHKDFYARALFSRAGQENYKREAAPVRDVIAWHQRRHPGAPVLLADESDIADATVPVFVNNWHQSST